MKKILLFMMLHLCLQGAAQTCTNLISGPEFQQKFSQLANKGGDENKLSFCRSFLPNYCFTSQQVKQLAMSFNGDASRLQFAKAAYERTFDIKNYYDVLDAFKSFSAAMRLYHFMDNQAGKNNFPEPAPQPVPLFPSLPYPLCDNYKGLKGCGLPLADRDFELLVGPLFGIHQDAPRMNAGRDFIKSNCVSMSQFMKITSLIELESNRLQFMKDQFMLIYDLENYSYAAAVLSNIPYQKDWNAFASSQLNKVNPPPPPPCFVSPSEFGQLKSAVDKEISSNTRLNVAKQVISAKKCFNALQIKELAGMMSFESTKLELAKFAYDFCIDQENYYQVNDVFSFSSSKTELMEFVKGKK